MLTATVAGCALAALLTQTVGALLLLRRRLDRRERVVLAAQLLLIAVTWLCTDGRVEGRILFTFAKTHGVTSSDLFALPAFALVPWLASRTVRRTLRGWTSR